MVIDDRIEIMELVTSIMGSKAPRDSAALRIAFGLQCGNALAQLLHAFHPTRQTATGKNTDLGHVQPGFHVWACNGTPHAAKCGGPQRVQRLHTGQQPYAYSSYPARCECIPPADRPHPPASGCSGHSRSW